MYPSHFASEMPCMSSFTGIIVKLKHLISVLKIDSSKLSLIVFYLPKVMKFREPYEFPIQKARVALDVAGRVTNDSDFWKNLTKR